MNKIRTVKTGMLIKLNYLVMILYQLIGSTVIRAADQIQNQTSSQFINAQLNAEELACEKYKIFKNQYDYINNNMYDLL